MITYSTDPRAQRLNQFLAAYVRENPRWAYAGNQWGWPAELRTVEAVAAEMLAAIGFREVQLTQVLDSPDGQLIRQVVASVLPYPYGAEFDLLVAAVEHAAAADVGRRRGAVAMWSAVAAVLLIALVWPKS